MSAWKTSVGSVFLAEHRRQGTCSGSHHLPNHSTAIAWKLRRPASFAAATRFWKHDISDSLAAVELGPLDEASIRHTPVLPEPTTLYGQLAEYEETTDAALDSLGFLVSWEIVDRPGVYVCHPYVRSPVGSTYSRWHARAIADLGAQIVQSCLKAKLSTRLALSPTTGYIEPSQRKSFEESVYGALKAELLEQPSGAVPRCSAVSFALSATDDLRASSASRVVHYTATATSQGYAEDFSGTFALI
jgi:hypothetical protein